ncbi:MAG: methyltransferase domain-containing protein [Magnetospirillum sp.]|nr:methyltransferase domain-containing protein [Magnetospirillum sp.]
MSVHYDDRFLTYADRSGLASAEQVISILQPLLRLASVVDVGCARGTWLSVWHRHGVADICGVDGAYVDPSTLRISVERFHAMDLSRPFSLHRRFDLAQSFEVAEHLPAERAAGFIADLVNLAPLVLFSAARPGQGGENHVNEQPPEYWRALFAAHDYLPLDPIRTAIRGKTDISPWYRYNMLMYCRRDHIAALPPAIGNTLIEPSRAVPEFAPIAYRLRCRVVNALPATLQHALARLKSHWMAR